VEKLYPGDCQILSLLIEQMSKLFRETPHVDVVLLMLRELGFSGLNDTKLFSANELKLETIDHGPLCWSHFIYLVRQRDILMPWIPDGLSLYSGMFSQITDLDSNVTRGFI